MEILVFWFTYDYSLVPKVMAGQHWLSGEEHLRSHYLYQWWLSLLRHLCVTQLWCLTHWGRVTHICVSKLTIIGRRQAIIWTNDGILLIGSLGTNFSEILVEIITFSFKKMHLKISSVKWRPFCLGLNVLTHWGGQNVSRFVDGILKYIFYSMETDIFQFKFQWSLFSRAHLTIHQHLYR